MASCKPWTHDELMLAMNLYCKLPFGQLRHGNSMIIAVAQKLGRTPSSLSMKLCNLASLDPYHQARGIRGLQGANRTYREEVLNLYLFRNLNEVRETTYWWMIDYNEQRPHDSLGNMTPLDVMQNYSRNSI